MIANNKMLSFIVYVKYPTHLIKIKILKRCNLEQPKRHLSLESLLSQRLSRLFITQKADTNFILTTPKLHLKYYKSISIVTKLQKLHNYTLVFLSLKNINIF